MTDPARLAEIERSMARRMARRHALEAGERGEHDYLPKTHEEALKWEPHEWVIKALIDARTENLND